MKTSRILAAAATLAALTAAAAIGVEHARRANAPGLPVQSDAAATAAVQPDAVAQLLAASLTDPDGKPRGLSPYKSRVLVVNFWASWCAPCVREMPTLSEVSRQYAGRGVQFVGIGVDSQKNVQTFLQKIPVDYPIFVSGFGGADLARAFGDAAGGLPFTVVIDANGSVRSSKLGEITAGELRRTLDAM